MNLYTPNITDIVKPAPNVDAAIKEAEDNLKPQRNYVLLIMMFMKILYIIDIVNKLNKRHI